MRYIIILLLLLSCTKEFQPEPEFIDIPQDTIPVPHILLTEIIYNDIRYEYQYNDIQLVKRMEYGDVLKSITYYKYKQDSMFIEKYDTDSQLILKWDLFFIDNQIKSLKTNSAITTFIPNGYIKYFIDYNEFDTIHFKGDDNIEELSHFNPNFSDYYTHDDKINPLRGRFYYLVDDFTLYFNTNNILVDSNHNKVRKYKYKYSGNYPISKSWGNNIVTFKYDEFFNTN